MIRVGFNETLTPVATGDAPGRNSSFARWKFTVSRARDLYDFHTNLCSISRNYLYSWRDFLPPSRSTFTRHQLQVLSCCKICLVTPAQDPGASGDPGKGSEDQKKGSAKDDSRSHRETPDRRPNPGDSPSDDDEDNMGKGVSHHDPKGKGRQRGPPVINIPFKSTLLTTGPKGNCDQFTTRAGIDIMVHGFLKMSSVYVKA